MRGRALRRVDRDLAGNKPPVEKRRGYFAELPVMHGHSRNHGIRFTLLDDFEIGRDLIQRIGHRLFYLNAHHLGELLRIDRRQAQPLRDHRAKRQAKNQLVRNREKRDGILK